MEKNNDMTRSIVLRKSNNWDSPAEIIRAEHRMSTLCHRDRRKRTYTKRNVDFWSTGKQAQSKEFKKRCISIQQTDLATEDPGKQKETL